MQFWRETLAGQHGAVFVAVDEDGTLAGEIGVHPHQEYGWILGMLVNQNFRGRGIGRALMDTALAWARERGVPSISLLVFPHNEAAIALYRKMGFEDVERFERDVVRQTGEVWDVILMRKTLS